MNNQWLNDLHRKMEDHEEDIPDGLWEDIKDELFSGEEENRIAGGMLLETEDEKINKTIPSGKRNHLLYRISGIAAAIAILFFTGKILLEMDAEKTASKITDSRNTDIKEKGRKNIESEKVNTDTNELAHIGTDEKYSSKANIWTEKTGISYIIKNIFSKETNDTNSTILDGWQKQNNISPLAIEELPFYNPTPESKKQEKEENTEEIFNDKSTLPEKYAANDTPKVFGRQSKKWMLSMLTGNVSSNSAEQKFPGYASISGSPMTFSDVLISTSTETDPLTEVLLANQSKEVEARIRHKVPVTFGFSVYYNLGKKWGIGTGVNYTKLTSELHSGSNSNYIKGDQSVHYIGIPVQVNYNVIQKGRFTGYVTAGMLAEKAIAGKLKTKYIVNNDVQETQEERLDIKPVQFSVNSAVGLQMKIVDKIGIYAEPGIGYHFRNDSQLNTIYKEKPLNFNMKFGIRLLLD